MSENEGDLDLQVVSETTSLLPKQYTPLNTLQMMMICLVTFVEPVQFGMLFPFVYFMVKEFHVAQREQDLGFYVGMLASSFCVAQLFTSLPWGWVSDRIGVVKSMLGEMTNSSNRGRAFSYWEAAYGIGTIVGPVLGGLLVNPCEQFPETFGKSELFRTFPYLLPCIVSGVVSVSGALVGFIYMEESAPLLRKKKGELAKEEVSTSTTTLQEEDISLIDNNGATPIHLEECEKPIRRMAFFEIMNWKVCMAIFSYATWCLVYALYVAEPLRVGGLQMSSFEMGIILSASGIAQVISQLLIYPIVEARLGFVGSFRFAAILMAIFAFLLPFCTDYAKTLVQLPEGVYSEQAKVKVFCVLFFLLAGKTLASVCGYIPVIILVNDAAPPTELGTVHGCGQVAASLVRSLGPAIGGMLWSWSLVQPFPFDFHFTLFLVSFLSLGAIWQSFYI